MSFVVEQDEASAEKLPLPSTLSRLALDWVDFFIQKSADIGQTDTLSIHYVKSHEAQERTRIRNLLREAIQSLKDKNSLGDVEATRYATEIEETLFFNYFYSFEGIYYAKAFSLCENLSKNASSLLSHYDAQLLCFFPTDALASGTPLDQWRAKYRHMLSQKMQAQKKQKKGIFECPKCHLNNTDYFTLQTRGADEPATIFVECFNCSKHFKR